MLIKRILTAVVLLAVLLPALFYGSPNVFNALTLLLIAAAVWEWVRMNGYKQATALFFAACAFLMCFGLMLWGVTRMPLFLLWLVGSTFWVLIAVYLLTAGVTRWASIPQAMRLVTGVFALCLAWLAVAHLREIGINLLLSVLLLVWAADIFAYIFGRAFGRRRLAPSISPGKTWEGVAGGLIGVFVVALCWLWVDANYSFDGLSLYSLLLTRLSGLAVLPIVFFTLMAVVGDLIESLVKRSAGVKDSSGLLPGHGGVLDRVDALLPVLPIAMLFVSLAR